MRSFLHMLWTAANPAKPIEEPDMLYYNGVLTDREMDWIRGHVNEGYKFIVEVREFPNYEWYKTLKQQKYWRTSDGMGQEYTQEYTGTLHTTIRLNDERDENHHPVGGGFILFNNDDDYQKALVELDDLITNPTPFYCGFSVK